MTRTPRAAALVASLALLGTLGSSQGRQDIFFRAMRDEMARSMQRLRLDTLPAPYFIAYRLTESSNIEAAATFGSLVRSSDGRNRSVNVELRVGDYSFDNSNFSGGPQGATGFGPIPMEDDYQEVRRQLWLATDNAYKSALEQLAQKRAALRNVNRTDDLADFSRQARDSVVDEMAAPPADRKQAETLVMEISKMFRQMPDVFTSSAQWTAGDVTVRYLNSEGTVFTRRAPWIGLRVQAASQAADGALLEDVLSYYGSRPSELPTREVLAAAVKGLGGRLSKLRGAPRFDEYNGPVLFEREAAAEVFNTVFAPRLVALRRPVSRTPGSGSGGSDNSFLDQIGGRVLPAFMNVTDDPTRVEYAGKFLGGYRVDDDGVRSHPTSLVEHGILKTLLNGRVPVKGIEKSTGSRWGGGPVVSNLFVTADKGVSTSDLRALLLAQVRERGKEYGIIVRRVANPALGGGLDLNSVMLAMMMSGSGGGGTLRTIEAYKVFPDGREELVRNADVVGLAPATFKEILAASDSSYVYTAPFSARGIPTPGGFGYAASYVVPSVLFEDVAMRGPRGEIPKPPVAKHPFFDTP